MENNLNNPTTVSEANNPAPIPPSIDSIKGRNHMKLKVLIGILISLVVIIVIFATVIQFYIVNKANELNQANMLLDSYIPSVTPMKFANLSTDNWKTFAGNHVGINFKYPNTWYEVDSKSVSQVPISDLEKNFQSYRDGKKIANLINVSRYAGSINKAEFDANYKNYLKLKNTNVNSQVPYDEEEDESYLRKIQEGKLSSGQTYIIFSLYEYDYVPENPEDKNSDVVKKEKSLGLSAYILDRENLYQLSLGDSDKQGEDIFANLIKSVQVNSKPIEDKIYNNNIISFKYPSYGNLEESDTIRGHQLSISLTTDNSSIFIVNKFFDPSKYGNGSFKVKGTWWNEAICKSVPIDSEYKFTYLNGYPVIIIQPEYQPNYYDVYVLNKPYVLHIEADDEDIVKNINDISKTVKYKSENKTIDSDLLGYLKGSSKFWDYCSYKAI